MSDPADIHPLWLGLQPLVLASGSRTRLDLLSAAGLPVRVVKPNVDERAIAAPHEAAGQHPRRIAVLLAKAKALAGSAQADGAWTVGADQTLALDAGALHKPTSRQDAAAQLRRLSGRLHTLHSAVALAAGGRVKAQFVRTARLDMLPLTETLIERYLDAAGDRVLESVGGYQLEGVGIHLFRRVDGDHSTILGLPLLPLLARLRQFGLVAS